MLPFKSFRLYREANTNYKLRITQVSGLHYSKFQYMKFVRDSHYRHVYHINICMFMMFLTWIIANRRNSKTDFARPPYFYFHYTKVNITKFKYL